jgi:hypothetical protein
MKAQEPVLETALDLVTETIPKSASPTRMPAMPIGRV